MSGQTPSASNKKEKVRYTFKKTDGSISEDQKNQMKKYCERWDDFCKAQSSYNSLLSFKRKDPEDILRRAGSAADEMGKILESLNNDIDGDTEPVHRAFSNFKQHFVGIEVGKMSDEQKGAIATVLKDLASRNDHCGAMVVMMGRDSGLIAERGFS